MIIQFLLFYAPFVTPRVTQSRISSEFNFQLNAPKFIFFKCSK